MADLIPPFPLDPPTSTDPASFDIRADSAWTHLADKVVPGINALPATLAASIGTGVIPYKFKTATSGDPGAGGLRLNNGTQTSATGAGLDLLDALGQDVTGRLARMGTGTSAVKGEVTFTKVGDGTVWLNFQVTSATSPTGYRSLVLANGVGSSANPFAADDDVVASYVANGDQGTAGPAYEIRPNFAAYAYGTSGAGRLFNTVLRNANSWPFTGVQLTLPEGDYIVSASSIVDAGSVSALWLRNVTDGADIVFGPNAFGATVGEYQFTATALMPMVPFSLAAQKVVQLEHRLTGAGVLTPTADRNAYMAIWKRG